MTKWEKNHLKIYYFLPCKNWLPRPLFHTNLVLNHLQRFFFPFYNTFERKFKIFIISLCLSVRYRFHSSFRKYSSHASDFMLSRLTSTFSKILVLTCKSGWQVFHWKWCIIELMIRVQGCTKGFRYVTDYDWKYIFVCIAWLSLHCFKFLPHFVFRAHFIENIQTTQKECNAFLIFVKCNCSKCFRIILSYRNNKFDWSLCSMTWEAHCV